jgi:hypothetical protein
MKQKTKKIKASKRKKIPRVAGTCTLLYFCDENFEGRKGIEKENKWKLKGQKTKGNKMKRKLNYFYIRLTKINW